MTNREFLSAISTNGSLSADLREFALSAIARLDKRNEKRRNTPTKAQTANEPVKAAIAEAVENGAHFASEIAVVVGVSTQKVSALCRQMVDDGVLTVKTVKVKGKGEVKFYAVTEDGEDEGENA